MIEPLQVPVAGIQYRELTADEIQSVAHVFLDTGNPLPNPTSSFFVGAVENGKVLGFLVVQAKIHAEPLWIETGRSNIFGSLAKKAEEIVLQRCGSTWIYLFAPAGKVSQMASVMGFGLEPWNVLSRLVIPEVPTKGIIDLLPGEPTLAVEQKPEIASEDAPFDIKAAYEASQTAVILDEGHEEVQ